jgi:aquaporin Z
MVSACLFTILLEYPGSPVHQFIPSPLVRRALIGIAMGLTAICIIYSPWGKQSGAHINPAVTLTFFRLGKIAPWDAFFYILAQFIGGLAGVWLVAAVVGQIVAHPTVNFVTTLPGPQGPGVAFGMELLISFGLMLMVLITTNTGNLGRYTGLFAGILVATYITVEAPFSGMSMNPARSLASAAPAQQWMSLWIYFTAPFLGMLLAAELYVRRRGISKVFCAKLNHHNHKRCIFCEYQARHH